MITPAIRRGLLAGLLWIALGIGALSSAEPDDLSDMHSINLQDAELEQVLLFLGKITGKRYYYDTRDIAGIRINIIARDLVTSKQLQNLLEAALEQQRMLLIEIENDTYTVVPWSQRFKRASRLDIPIHDADEIRHPHRLHTITAPVRHARAEELAMALRDLLTPELGSVAVVAGVNSLLITDYGHQIPAILQTIEALDLPASAVTIQLRLSIARNGGDHILFEDRLDAVCRKPGAAEPSPAAEKAGWSADATMPLTTENGEAVCEIHMTPVQEMDGQWRIEYAAEWHDGGSKPTRRKHGEIRVETGIARGITLHCGNIEYRCEFTLTPAP